MCDMLKTRLDKAGIPYTVEMDANLMIAQGIKCVPALALEDGRLLDAVDAIKYLNGGEANVR